MVRVWAALRFEWDVALIFSGASPLFRGYSTMLVE